MPGTQEDHEGNTQFYATVDTDFSWDDFPLEEQERMREAIISNVTDEIDREAIIHRVLEDEWDDFFEEIDVEEFMARMFTQAGTETIARNIPEEVVQECVEEQMSTTTTTQNTVKKAKKETLISIFRVVAIAGAALGAILSATFAISGGFPLALVTLVMAAFCVYAYQYQFDEE